METVILFFRLLLLISILLLMYALFSFGLYFSVVIIALNISLSIYNRKGLEPLQILIISILISLDILYSSIKFLTS